MQALEFAAGRTAQGLAIDGNLRKTHGLVQCLHPRAKTTLESLRIEPVKNPLEGVMGRNAIGQCQESLQPVQAAASESGDLLPIIAATNHAAEGDGDDIDETMHPAALDPGVLELAEILLDREIELRHKSPP